MRKEKQRGRPKSGVSLHFTLPDDENALTSAMNGWKYLRVIESLKKEMRDDYKYGDGQRGSLYWHDRLWEVLAEFGVSYDIT